MAKFDVGGISASACVRLCHSCTALTTFRSEPASDAPSRSIMGRRVDVDGTVATFEGIDGRFGTGGGASSRIGLRTKRLG